MSAITWPMWRRSPRDRPEREISVPRLTAAERQRLKLDQRAADERSCVRLCAEWQASHPHGSHRLG
jgi:hypothetical protein